MEAVPPRVQLTWPDAQSASTSWPETLLNLRAATGSAAGRLWRASGPLRLNNCIGLPPLQLYVYTYYVTNTGTSPNEP